MSQQSTSAAIISQLMRRILLLSAIAGIAIGLIGAVIGGLVVGVSGVYSALIGAAVAFVFFGITAIIMLFTADSGPAVTAGAAMGGFLVKIALMFAVVAVLSGRDFYHPMVLFITLVAGAVASLAIETWAVQNARIPTVDPTAGKRD
ncbi:MULTISPECIES: hypothetical protein [unclassified Brevibacterium]|uniref:hypothetical protein n=1 Tax=unclassified Brevibacterium TaxID=2614124 RepID=UPI0008A5BF7B|nr:MULTISPECIES: hypothetical protein [unclassified Brevibacterium]OFL65200.1 hypothetical protein HMPREF2757_04795 [Brevibacterium sp. HMSC063G07]OFS25127.1 hypothetical protein HMPREF3162_09380 [Brevibacterium sp. HMSC07C04]